MELRVTGERETVEGILKRDLETHCVRKREKERERERQTDRN